VHFKPKCIGLPSKKLCALQQNLVHYQLKCICASKHTDIVVRFQAKCSALPCKMQCASKQNAACFQAKCSMVWRKMQCTHKQYTAHFPGMCFVFLGKMLSAKRWYHRSYSNEEEETNIQIFHQGDGNKKTIENWVLSNTVECDRRSYNWQVGFPLFF